MMGSPEAMSLAPPTLSPRISAASDGRGVIPRFFEDLFTRAAEIQDSGVAGGSSSAADTPPSIVSFRISLRYFEIYCEKVYDLLNNGSEGRVRDGGRIDKLTDHVVTSSEAVAGLLRKGNGMRTTATTLKNERSSRSHAVVQVSVHQDVVPLVQTARSSDEEPIAAAEPIMEPYSVQSVVNLVDLAGSERQKQSGASGQQFKEMVNINLSLTTLRRVIVHLQEKKGGKPPERESVLTHVLSNCFGGNSRTAMLIALSPLTSDVADTISTLEFADTAKKIVNKVSVNLDKNTLLLRGMAGN